MTMPYLLRRSARARTLRLTVYPDARVVVTAPIFAGTQRIQRFIETHSEWLRQRIAKTAGRKVIYLKRGEIDRIKRRAYTFASARCIQFATYYGLSYKKISIRAQKSRWGSCSRAGNLSFNYKIAILSPHIADYIIVHEICHLAEMNHSKKFWALVARTIPDHKAIRKELRNTVVTFS